MDTAARYFGLYDDATSGRGERPTERQHRAADDIRLLAPGRRPRRTGRPSSATCPAGFPTVDGGIEAVTALLEGGCDIVEVGLPHSDPVLDGPVIQTADDIALRGGVRIADVLRTVREAHAATGKPVLCMTYWNPVDRYGVERFAAELAEAGGAGCILPDLPVEESEAWRKAAEQHGLATVFVVAPSSKDERLAEDHRGRLRLRLRGLADGRHRHPRVGRHRRPQDLVAPHPGHHRAAGLRRAWASPTPNRPREVAAFADGVIVGSAFVKRLLDAPDDRRPGSPRSARWRASWPRASAGGA